MFRAVVLASLALAVLQPVQTVTIRVDARAPIGPMPPIWAFFGYDEPNYTYTANGKRLLSELAELSPVPVYVRAHNLLTSGDGTPALKWGSTNAYSIDAAGRPKYDCRRRCRPVHSRTATTGRRAWITTASTPAGPIRRRTMRRGATWSRHGRGTRSNATGRVKSTAGTGKCGTNQTSATGTARPRNTTSCTTMRPTG